MDPKFKSKLESSPMFYLSSGSKELFHSNFLYWIGIKHRDLFEAIMTELCDIRDNWPTNWEVKREYKNFDLSVVYKDGSKNKPKEYFFIVLENKVKSLPDAGQLVSYQTEIQKANKNKVCNCVLLSLVTSGANLDSINKNNWKIKNYEDLVQIITNQTQQSSTIKHKVFIEDYCDYVSTLSNVAESWELKKSDQYLTSDSDLIDLRLDDVYQKLRYSQMAVLLEEALKEGDVFKNTNNVDSPEIIMGMSSFEPIINNNKKAKVRHWWKDCEDRGIKGHVFIGWGMSHAVGFIEAGIRISDDCCFYIQVQGDRYCHAVVQPGIYKKAFPLQFNQEQENFINFDGQRSNEALCHYGDGFVYKYEKIDNKATIEDVINRMKNDIKKILG